MEILFYPIIVALLLIVIVVLLIFKKLKIAGIFFVVFIIANLYSQSIAFHPLTSGNVDNEPADSNSLRIMTYNSWIGGTYLGKHREDSGEELVHSLDSMNVDILLMCELSKNDNPLILDSISKNYPYNIIEFSDSFKRNECQVFSKYPIKNLRTVNYNDTISNGAIWLMEVETDSGKINLAAVHLASNRYGSIRDTMNASSTWLSGYKSYIRYTKEGYAIRAAQAIALRDSLDCLEGPIIVMGDFNDIGGSYAVKKIMGNDLGDAWWNGGFGYGFTYDMYHLLLRLDHILYSERIFDLEGVKVLDDWKYSDHYPLVADFSYK